MLHPDEEYVGAGVCPCEAIIVGVSYRSVPYITMWFYASSCFVWVCATGMETKIVYLCVRACARVSVLMLAFTVCHLRCPSQRLAW